MHDDPSTAPAGVPGRTTLVLAQLAHGAHAEPPAKPVEAPTSGGAPIAAAVRQKMEAAFGADFSAVRIHHGGHAAALGALAFTRGDHIHFAPGVYAPDTPSGQELLGHELTHVVQQRQGRVAATAQAKGLAIHQDAGLEHEADVMGARAARGEPAQVTGSGSAPAGARAGVTQCKLGFEFQTVGTNTGYYVPGETKDDPPKRLKEGKITYFQGEGYSVEGDEGDLELVTTAFDETESGFQQMAKVFSRMEVFAESIQGQTIPLTGLRYPGLAPVDKSLAGKDKVTLHADGKIVADPQTTVGIRLDQLFGLGTALAGAKPRPSAYVKGKESGTMDPTGKPERTRPTYGEDPQELADHIGWKAYEIEAFQGIVRQAREIVLAFGQMYSGMAPSTQGFLFLIAAYARGAPNYVVGGKKGFDPLCAKFAMPIMSRTNLADAFMVLPKLDRLWFAKQHEMIAGKLRGQDEGTTLFKAARDDKGEPWEQFRDEFSIQDWLAMLIPKDLEGDSPGTDLTSLYESVGDISKLRTTQMLGVSGKSFADPDKASSDKDTARDRYFEHVKAPTDIGPATDGGDSRMNGVILELRKLGAKLTVDEWWPFASSVFKLIAMLNQGKGRKDEIVDAFIKS